MNAKHIDQQWREYCKWQRQNHMRECSLEEFTRYVRGQGGLGQSRTPGTLKSRPSPHDDRMAAYRAIPSRVGTGPGACGRNDNPRYTGDYVRGISVMHKSNAVPVVDDQHIKDISRMRR